MRTVVCKRCEAKVPKHATRQNKVFGGRICPACSDYMGELADRSLMEKPVTPTVAPKFVEQKKGFFGRIAQKLFRRRGVQ